MGCPGGASRKVAGYDGPVLFLFACAPLDPAPEDVDGLLHYLWTWYDDGTDEQLAEVQRNVHSALGAELEETLDGTVSDLTDADVALVGMGGDPAAAQGLFIARPLACTLEQLERVVSHQDQLSLYPDAYETYQRTFTSDYDAYMARHTPTLSWELENSNTLLGAWYSSVAVGRLRYLPDLGAELTPHGPGLHSRIVMTEPASFEEGSNKSLEQNYQLEVFYERSPGELVHVYATWQQGDFGGVTTDDEAVQRLVVNNMAAWDDDTEVLCAEGRP